MAKKIKTDDLVITNNKNPESFTASILVVASVWISAGINSNLEQDYGTSTWSFSTKVH